MGALISMLMKVVLTGVGIFIGFAFIFALLKSVFQMGFGGIKNYNGGQLPIQRNMDNGMYGGRPNMMGQNNSYYNNKQNRGGVFGNSRGQQSIHGVNLYNQDPYSKLQYQHQQPQNRFMKSDPSTGIFEDLREKRKAKDNANPINDMEIRGLSDDIIEGNPKNPNDPHFGEKRYYDDLGFDQYGFTREGKHREEITREMIAKERIQNKENRLLDLVGDRVIGDNPVIDKWLRDTRPTDPKSWFYGAAGLMAMQAVKNKNKSQDKSKSNNSNQSNQNSSQESNLGDWE